MFGYVQGNNYLKILAKILFNYSEGVFFRIEGGIFAGIIDGNRNKAEILFLNILDELGKIDINPKISINIGARLINRMEPKMINYNKTYKLLREAQKMGNNNFIIE